MNIIKQVSFLFMRGFTDRIAMYVDLPFTRYRFRYCSRPYKCSIHRRNITSLPATQSCCDGNCRCGGVTGCNLASRHAQQSYQWKTWFCKWCPCQCGHEWLPAFHRKSPDANKAPTETKDHKLYARFARLVERWCFHLCLCRVRKLCSTR
jgi:hypothetical protein